MTNLTAFSTVVAVATLLATMRALAALPATAPPARGDPPVTEGASGGTGAGGGAEPLGGITDAPPPQVPNTDGSWTATIGGAEFAGLTEADVGRVLWRGETVLALEPDEFAIPSLVEVCEPLPSVILRSMRRVRTPGVTSLSVLADFRECTLRVGPAATTLGIPSSADQDGGESVLPGFGASTTPRSWPIVWSTGERSGSSVCPRAPRCPTIPGVRSEGSEVIAQMFALDGLGLLLTEVKFDRCYRVDNFMTTDTHIDCRSRSPASPLIYWYEDACDGITWIEPGAAMASATGEFHARRAPFYRREWEHTHEARLRGDAAWDAAACEITPDSMRDIRAYRLAGVELRCSHAPTY